MNNMGDYKQKYEEAREKISMALNTGDYTREAMERAFPELRKSEDERIRKEIISFLKEGKPYYCPNSIRRQEWVSWLEKQGEESKRLYVRFGEIPEDECSGVYHAGELVGKEEGVSVYDAKIDNYDNVLICIPLPINKNTLDTFQNLVEYDNRNCYLVKGTCVGKGSDNEPIIRNVSIVKRIDNYRIKESDKKSDQNLDNFCKTCKGEQKQHLELKAGHWYLCYQAYCERADILTVKEGEMFKCEKDGIVKGLIIKEPEKYFREISTPSDKVEPKFKVGDTIVEKDLDECGCGTIVNIKDGKYIFDDRCFIRIKEQERWQLVEQKSTNKVEPKFKVGDWVRAISSGNIFKILSVNDGLYCVLCYDGVEANYPMEVEKDLAYWTIQDAKDGDVLVNGSNIFIFHFINGTRLMGYCHVNTDDGRFYDDKSKIECFCLIDAVVYPATKEQRDLLFSKMHEAGYEWDAEKKELKKIEQCENYHCCGEVDDEAFQKTLQMWFDKGKCSGRDEVIFHPENFGLQKQCEQNPEIKDDVLSRFAFYQYDDDTIYLSSLFVRESDRGRGYGSKVLKAAEEVAKTFGISKIRLKVERNTWMEEWYKKNGYEYLSSEGKYDWLENRVIDIKPDKIEQKPINSQFTPEQSSVLDKHIDKFLEQKPAWSEDDEYNLNWVIKDYEKASQTAISSVWEGHFKIIVDWLKSLKEKVQPQPKQEWSWSEEDEEMFDAIIADIQFTQKAHNHEVNQVVYEREIDWFKAIKERYTWKPSDEQIEALWDSIPENVKEISEREILLDSLYQDLKKLRKE